MKVLSQQSSVSKSRLTDFFDPYYNTKLIFKYQAAYKRSKIRSKWINVGTSINDVPLFFGHFSPTYLPTSSITSNFGGYFGLPTYPNIERH